jgi:hypothetical protein
MLGNFRKFVDYNLIKVKEDLANSEENVIRDTEKFFSEHLEISEEEKRNYNNYFLYLKKENLNKTRKELENIKSDLF